MILLIGVEPGRLYGQDNGSKAYPARVRCNGGASQVGRSGETKSESQVPIDRYVGHGARG
jgi:hypothetical protein